MNKFKQLAEILKKAGEGSKGGSIIGHTRTGKPIYSSSSHAEHATFKSPEHRDAMNLHHDIWTKTQNKLAQVRQNNPSWHPPKQVHQFMSHHYTQMQMHQNRASAKEANENRTKIAQHARDKSTLTRKSLTKGLNDLEIPLHAAVVVISPDKKKVLLGKREKDGNWESPAGHADIGERPEEVAIRECFEEFGVPLREDQLQHLPIMYKKDMTPCHCFMAIAEKHQLKNITVEDDPSEEHTKWKWFRLDEKLPDGMEDNRFNTIIHAKMELAKLEEMTKSFLNMQDMEGDTAVNTADLAQEHSSFDKEQDLIEQHMDGYSAGDEPRVIPLDDSSLFLVRVDDGLYSGFVKRTDRQGLTETVAHLDKMPISSIVQFLRAKQIIGSAKRSAKEPELDLKQLLSELIVKQSKSTVYVSMDGDNIGNRVAQAEALDDEQALREFSRRINAGQTVFETWAHSVGGEVIEGGGDEALAKVPSDAKDKIEFFRAQYEQVVGATVTVGVGESISQSTKARELGKLKGKNRTEVFITGKSDDELGKLFKPEDPIQKLKNSGVLALVKALLLKGGPLEIGTVREWGDRKYVKHADGWVVIGGLHDGKLMGNFLDEPTHGDYARFHAKTSVSRDDGAEKSSNSAKKAFSEGGKAEGLIEKLQKGMKGEGHPVGTIRHYEGMKFVKEGSGHWMPMAQGVSSDETNMKVHQSQPSSVAQPKEEHEGASSEIPMSMADQSGESTLDHVKGGAPKVDRIKPGKNVPDTDLQLQNRNERGALNDLEPREGVPGGHVSLHSSEIKKVLKDGPYSVISAGRNHKHPKDAGMTDEAVTKRHKKLEEELKDTGHKYSKISRQAGSKTPGFMVHHADEQGMNELGKKYNQESVIHSKAGKNKMAFTNGEHEGKWHEGDGYQELKDPKDYFTQIDSSDRQQKKFEHNLDYGKFNESEDGTVD